MPTVVVIGAGTPLGRRVLTRLSAATAWRTIAVDDGGGELKRLLHDADAVVHAGSPDTVATVLDAVGATGVDRVVIESTAAVYGAWPDNRVPLSEDIPLRPNPGFAYATRHAEAERAVAEFRDDHPGVAVAVLRLAPVLFPGEETWVSRALARPSPVRAADGVPPAQYLHAEDAASAVDHALTERLDGVFNVAPEGSLPGETARALAGMGPPFPLPDRLVRWLERVAFRLGIDPLPPAGEPYRSQPWVIATDRLRATGWRASYASDEALVAVRKGSWWRELTPNRRQEIALGAVGGVGAALTAAIVAVVRSSRGRR